jgi:chromate transporter
MSERAETGHGVALSEAFVVWARVAALSFGGPAGQIAVMHRIIVEERKWISESRFLHGLNYCMLLPGPEAQQLATYIGWLMHRTIGGLMAGGLFVAPGAAALLALSYVYVLYGHIGAVAGLFFGLKSAVLAIVVEAVQRLGRRALTGRASRLIAASAFLAIFAFQAPFPAIILCAGFIGFVQSIVERRDPSSARSSPPAHDASLLGEATPDHAAPSRSKTIRTAALWLALWTAPTIVLLGLAPGSVYAAIALFFSKMAVVTFGGAYAVLAYVAQQSVEHYHWLGPSEMLDGLGMAETTPGPLIMVTQFVGFLAAYRAPGALSPALAGLAGAALTTWVTFAPCFLWIFVGGPFIESLRSNKALAAALRGITAAVVGVILNLALWFAIHAIFRQTARVGLFGASFDAPVLSSVDPAALALTIAAGVAIFGFRVNALTTLAASAILGAALKLSGWV